MRCWQAQLLKLLVVLLHICKRGPQPRVGTERIVYAGRPAPASLLIVPSCAAQHVTASGQARTARAARAAAPGAPRCSP
jgi:hypothetical protein